jgi:hypothetical protein
MDSEDYMLIEAKNAEDFFKFVDKYELDLSEYLKALDVNNEEDKEDEMQFPSLKSPEAQHLTFPKLLPYTKSVPLLNDLLASFLD